MCSVQKETFTPEMPFNTGKNDYIVSNVPPFIKDELNTELFRTNSFTNDESKSPLLKHASLS